MKKIILTSKKNYYKANLHTHSIISDGQLSVEELKKAYLEKGIQIVAFTDHDVFIRHNDLTDDNFLALNGYEIEVNKDTGLPRPMHRSVTAHICFVALSPDTTTPACLHRSKYLIGNGEKYVHLVDFGDQPDFEREYTPECVNEIIRKGKEMGFFVTYNHPSWSGEGYPQYIQYEGMDAMEIYNHECFLVGVEEYNGRVYDDFLRAGKRLYCTATDDTHQKITVGGGMTVFNADKRDYPTIATALKNGDFFSTNGPMIKELYVEDGYICIETDPAHIISLNTGMTQVAHVRGDDKPVTFAKFLIRPGYDYIRLTVIDEKRNSAHTNVYYPEELLK